MQGGLPYIFVQYQNCRDITETFSWCDAPRCDNRFVSCYLSEDEAQFVLTRARLASIQQGYDNVHGCNTTEHYHNPLALVGAYPLHNYDCRHDRNHQPKIITLCLTILLFICGRGIFDPTPSLLAVNLLVRVCIYNT